MPAAVHGTLDTVGTGVPVSISSPPASGVAGCPRPVEETAEEKTTDQAEIAPGDPRDCSHDLGVREVFGVEFLAEFMPPALQDKH